MPGSGIIAASRIPRKDCGRAIADYTQAIMLDPNNTLAFNNRGNAYYAEKGCDRAIADYTEAIRLDSKLASAYTGRGNAYNAKGEIDRADADFN
jgi:tetratricopeptide (TPR) repeat protein